MNQSGASYFKAFIHDASGIRTDIPFIPGTEQFTPADMSILGQVVGVVRQGGLQRVA